MNSNYRFCITIIAWVISAVAAGRVPDCLAEPAEETENNAMVFCSTKGALSQVSNEREVMSALKSLVEVEMPAALGFKLKMRVFDSDQEMYQMLSRHEADMGCGHLTKFVAQYKRGKVKPIIWFYQNGKDGDRYCFILRKEEGYSRPEELRGLVLGYNDPQDLAKAKYSFFRRNPAYASETYFSKTRLYHNTKDMLHSLKMHRVDVVFDSLYTVETALNLKNVKGEFATINSDEVLADLPIFIRADLEPEKLAKIESIKGYFINMHKTPKTRYILQLLGCDEAREVGEEQEIKYREWIRKYSGMGLM